MTLILTNEDIEQILTMEDLVPALEDAYVDSATELGAPLLVLLEGGIDNRPTPDGGGEETMLIVARFVESWPGQACSTAKPDTD